MAESSNRLIALDKIFNVKDMFRCYEHHRQLQNICKTVLDINSVGETCIINYEQVRKIDNVFE